MMHGDVTELRLGLPGGGVVVAGKTSGGKRGFCETEEEEEEEELKLNLSGVTKEEVKKKEKSECKANGAADPHVKPPAKAQVVGWPPVGSYRKKMVMEKENVLVKVSMDGAPYLRKVDLTLFKTYHHLSAALANMFTIRNYGEHVGKGTDFFNASDYVPTYEDKDGDWMLIGDVPWEMFVGSCKRLRIMKGMEAVGLAPRAMDKCKRRS